MGNLQSTPMDGNDLSRQHLSALMDGELDPADWAATCDALSRDSALRTEWHDWHLVGDALRSSELASAGQHDAAFLSRFRQRLAEEPVVFAPLPAQAALAAPAARRRLRWGVAPAAMAAGFVAVAGAMLLLRPGQGNDAPASIASTVPRDAGVQAAADVQMMRDARLDRYLGAHRRNGSGAAAQPYLDASSVRPVDAVMVAPK